MHAWLLLAAAFAADLDGATRWPLPLGEAEVERVDLDGDGAPDERATSSDGGSGYHTWTACVRHGASGHAACERVDSTAYSLFTGYQRVLAPAADNRAEALLGPLGCAAPDPASPAQGALWKLLEPVPEGGRFVPALTWSTGRPRDQESVCLLPAEAARFPGGLDWDPEGSESAAGDLAAAGWRAWYNASWNNVGPPGVRAIPPVADAERRTPVVVAHNGRLEVYQIAHALAVYDPVTDRHAWLLNLARPGDGFKLDRWGRIGAVEALPDGTLRVVPASWGDAGEDLIVEVGALPAE